MTDNPFAPALSRQSFVETTATLEALRRLDDGLGTREPFLLMTGGPGTGKSTLASEAIARWGSRVAVSYLPMRVTTGTELLEEILRRFGIESPGGDRRLELVARLEGALAEIGGRGQVAVIVVDDAHHLSPELLEDLRLLANAAQLARCPAHARGHAGRSEARRAVPAHLRAREAGTIVTGGDPPLRPPSGQRHGGRWVGYVPAQDLRGDRSAVGWCAAADQHAGGRGLAPGA